MTDEGEPRHEQRQRRPAPVLGWRARLESRQRTVMRLPPVVAGLQVLRAYDRAGGGMLSGGLSFYALFSVVPALLLFVSLLGLLIDDPAERQALVSDLIGQIEPLADLAESVIRDLSGTARTTTIVGIVGLLWGFSGFYGSLQSSMQRMFPGPGMRDFLRTRLRGLLTVALVLAAMLSAVLLIIILPAATSWFSERCQQLATFDSALFRDVCDIDIASVSAVVGPIMAVVIAILACLVVYVAIPSNGPSLRQAVLPALIAGIAIGLLTSLFGLFAEWIARLWLALGVVGSVFLTLVWFNLVFQMLLYGAAFARLRRDADRQRNGPARL